MTNHRTAAEIEGAAIDAVLAQNAELRAALERIEARPDAMIWGEDYECREAMRDMAREATAALAGKDKP